MNKGNKEARLNRLFSECYSEEQAVEELNYLTSKLRYKTRTTENNIRKQYRARKLGTLLKRLDPIAFNCAD